MPAGSKALRTRSIKSGDVLKSATTSGRRSGTNQRKATSMPEQLSFTAFVISLASTAAIHLGDLVDPMTKEKTSPNLEGAAQMIEILELLEEKTKGNLSAEERQVLEQVLYELRLRFVEVSGSGGSSGSRGSSGSSGSTGSSGSDDEPRIIIP